jgi:hypothetical protein
MPGLGYRKQPDPRNARFPATLVMAEDAPLRTRMHVMFKKELDQGNTGTCVGHTGTHLLRTSPIIQDSSPFFLYGEACKRDIWSENDNGDLQFGTSILALMKALRDMGFIDAYLWANGATQTARWIADQSPAAIGVNWYDSFFTPDKEGIIRLTPTSGIAGGHAILLRGWNNKRGLFRLVNSWGSNWAQQGQAWLPAEVLERLIREDGEVALPTEKRVNRNTVDY